VIETSYPSVSGRGPVSSIVTSSDPEVGWGSIGSVGIVSVEHA
jgi:hypothetical protein